MLWTEDREVDVQSYFLNHVDTLINLKNEGRVRFTDFCGHADLTNRHLSWNLL